MGKESKTQLRLIRGGAEGGTPRGRLDGPCWDADAYQIDEAFFEDALEALAEPPRLEAVRSTLPPAGSFGVEGFAACVASALDSPTERLCDNMKTVRSSVAVVAVAVRFLGEVVEELPFERAVAVREMLDLLEFDAHLAKVRQATDEGMANITELGAVLDGLHSIAPEEIENVFPSIPGPPRLPSAGGDR